MTDSDDIFTLVVDDSEFFAEMTAGTLADEHRMVTRACNSVEEAKQALQEEAVDCIVSDYEMPGQNGLEFLSWVRQRYDNLPFILLTGRGDEETASQAIAAGVADYLLKLEVVEDKQYERLANRIHSVVDQHRAEQKYQQLIDNSPDAIVHVATDGEILAVNQTFVDQWDTTEGEALGATFTDVLPDGIGESRLENGLQAIEADEPQRIDDSYDGRYFNNIFVPLEVISHRDSFQLISRDVTERKQRESQLRRQNERLETFASVVTHDLRNPLNVATGSLELLEDEVGDSEAYARIDRSLERMDALIDDVLTLARQGEEVNDPIPVALEDVAESAWANVEAPDAPFEIESSISLLADRGRLQQLLENLFRNAVEHGGPTTAVTVGAIEDEGFYVADDGPGIDPSARDAVLELGYSTSQGGTGMGLSIVTQIADAHDWDLSVTESASGGARFEITGVTES